MKMYTKYGSLILLALVAFAASANAAVCTSATLTTYIANGFNCSDGALNASEFATVIASAFGGTPTTSDAITVVPTGSNNNPGFNFDATYHAGGTLSTESVTIAYELNAPQGMSISAVDLSLTNASVTGLGTLVAGELLCLGGQFIADVCTNGVQVNVGTLSNALGNLGANLSITLGNQPVTELGVLKTITLDGVALTGSANASGLNNGYTVTGQPTPEPSSMLLLGTGMLGLAPLCRRWLKQ